MGRLNGFTRVQDMVFKSHTSGLVLARLWNYSGNVFFFKVSYPPKEWMSDRGKCLQRFWQKYPSQFESIMNCFSKSCFATKRDKIETTAWYSGISPGIMIFLWCYNLQGNHHNTANALRNREHLPSKDHLMTNKSWTKWKDQAMQSGDCHSAVAGITLNMYWIWPDSLF